MQVAGKIKHCIISFDEKQKQTFRAAFITWIYYSPTGYTYQLYLQPLTWIYAGIFYIGKQTHFDKQYICVIRGGHC